MPVAFGVIFPFLKVQFDFDFSVFIILFFFSFFLFFSCPDVASHCVQLLHVRRRSLPRAFLGGP